MPHMEDLTHDLKHMMALAADEPGDLKPLLDFGLEWMHRLGTFDLVAIFLLEGEDLVVKAAKGSLAQASVFRHSVPLDRFPSIRESLKAGGTRIFHEHDHSDGEGDLFDDVLDFPHGHACLVVPMHYGGQALGIISFDRAQCGGYNDQTIHLLEIYARILSMAIHQAEQSRLLARLHRESRERERLLVEEQGRKHWLSPLSSRCPQVQTLGETLLRVASTDATVLITGETGTGKEGIAALIHESSPRNKGPFLKINCSAIPADLLESELFGVVRGAFTGAVRDRVGRLRMANGGTLFLDEIGDMPQPLQAKLLRVLQEGTFEPVGSDVSVKVDVRFLAATNTDLMKAIAEKRFRSDLYYRLSVVPLHVPPLRERMVDLEPLCEILLQRVRSRLGRPGLQLTPAALAKLAGHLWPGNIRELANLLERSAILAPGNQVDLDQLELPFKTQLKCASTNASCNHNEEAPPSLEEVQRRHILSVLRLVKGKIYGEDGAAKLLKIKPSTLQSRMKKLGIAKRLDFH